MAILNDEQLARLGFLSLKQSTKHDYTDKPNTHLVFPRFINQEKAYYSSKVQIDICEYKTIVLSDWSIASDLTQSLDLALWVEWIELERKLYVYFEHQLIKIDSQIMLKHYLAHMNKAHDYNEISQALSDINIASDKSLIVDFFKRQEIKGLIKQTQNKNLASPTLERFRRLNLSELLDIEKLEIEKILASFQKGEATLDLILAKQYLNRPRMIQQHLTLLPQLIASNFFTGLCIDRSTLTLINLYLANTTKPFKIKHLDISGINIYAAECAALFAACPELTSLTYTPPRGKAPSSPLPAVVSERLASLNALSLNIKNDICDEKIQCFSLCTQLTSLEFSVDINLSDSSRPTLPDFLHIEHLTSLSVHKVDLNHKEPLTRCKKLTYLKLSDVIFNFEGDIVLPHLNTLILESIFDLDEDFFNILKNTPKLEHLSLYDCVDRGENPEEQLTLNLKSLHVSDGDIRDTINMLMFSSCHSLISLNIDFTIASEIRPYYAHSFKKLKYIVFNQEAMPESYGVDGLPTGQDIINFLSICPQVESFIYNNETKIKTIFELDNDKSETLKLKQLKSIHITGNMPGALFYIYKIIAASPNLEECIVSPRIYSGDELDDNQNNNINDAKERIKELSQALKPLHLKRCILGETSSNHIHPIYKAILELAKPRSLFYNAAEDTKNAITIPKQAAYQLKHLKLAHASLQVLLALAPEPSLQSLELTQSDLRCLEDFCTRNGLNARQLEQLEALTLRDISLYAKDLSYFLNRLPNLKFLNLTNVALSDSNISPLITRPLLQLKSVILHNCHFYQAWLPSMPNLQCMLIKKSPPIYLGQAKKLLKKLKKLSHVLLPIETQDNPSDDIIQEHLALQTQFPHISLRLEAIKRDKHPNTQQSSITNAQTELNHEKEDRTFHPDEYFIPKQNSNLGVANYRIKVHKNPATIDANHQLLFDYQTDDLQILSEEELEHIRYKKSDLRKQYDEKFHANDALHYGKICVVLSNKTWAYLPSLSPQDKIKHLYVDANVQLAYSQHLNLYAIKLTGQHDDELDIEVIIESHFIIPQALTAIEAAELHRYQDYFQHIQFALHQQKLEITHTNPGYDWPKRYTQFKENKFLSQISNVFDEPGNDPYILLLQFCMQNMRQFKKEKLTQISNDAISLLNTLAQEQKGACRHRAYLFKALFDCYQLPCRLIINDCHAFIEVKMSPHAEEKRWFTLDLGGYPATVKPQPSYAVKHPLARSKPRTNPMTMPLTYADGDTEFKDNSPQAASASSAAGAAERDLDEAMFSHEAYPFDFDSDDDEKEATTSLSTANIVQEAKTKKEKKQISDDSHYDFSQNRFALWAQVKPEPNDFASFWQALNIKIQGLAPGTQNLLLSFKNDSDLANFNQAMQKAQAANQARYYYLNSLDDINFHAAQVHNGRYSLAKSELVDYLEAPNPKEKDIFVVRWSAKPQHIAYNTLIDTQGRRLGQVNIPRQMTVILLIEEEESKNFREDFYSRIRIKKAVPQNIDCGPALQLVLDSSLRPEQIINLDLMGSDDWKNQLIGSIDLEGRQLVIKEGALTKAIRNKLRGLQLVHAAKHLNAIETFLKEIHIKGHYYFNGQHHALPANFNLSIADMTDYDWTGHYTLSTSCQENKALCSLILNAETYHLFFKSYSYLNQQLSPQLSANPGFIGQSSHGQSLNILVTDDLDEGQWASLIAHAKIHQTQMNFIIHASDLPSALLARITKATDQVAMMEIEPNAAAMPASATPAAHLTQVSYHIHDEVDFLLDQLASHNALIITITQDMGYEIIERIHMHNTTEMSDLSIQYNQGALAKALLAGQTVVLKIYEGMLSPALEANLESLFLASPYLWLNGRKTPFTGKLIIISNTDQYFSLFVHKTSVTADLAAQKSQLQRQFGEAQVQEFNDVCEAIGLTLSYTERKTFLKRGLAITADSLRPFILAKDNSAQGIKNMQAYFNARNIPAVTAPGLSQASAEAIDEFKLRAERISNFLNNDPCIFLIGATGSGKSSIVHNHLSAHYQETISQNMLETAFTLFVGMEKLAQWARAQKGMTLLFIDEANLLTEGSLEIFEGLYHPKPSLIIDGESIEISPNHKVIFAGNTHDYVGRTQHAFNQRHGHYLELSPLSDSTLINTFIAPFLDKKDPVTLDLVATVALNSYKFINERPASNIILTARNLKNITHRFNDLSAKAPEKIAIWLSCYDEIRYLVDKNVKRQFKARMLADKDMNLPAYKSLKSMLKQEASARTFDNYATTHLNARRLIQQFLKINSSHSGLILEGMPGLGKSTLAAHYLKEIPHQFLQALSKDEAEAQLDQCFHQGLVIIIDELNTLPFLEYSLNSFMMGQDLKGKSAQKPGFKVIATQNPISFGGRYALSPALENRFLKVKVKEYAYEDLQAIGKVKNLPEQDIAKLAQAFLIAKQHAEKHHLKPSPTARDYINALTMFTSAASADTAQNDEKDHVDHPQRV